MFSFRLLLVCGPTLEQLASSYWARRTANPDSLWELEPEQRLGVRHLQQTRLLHLVQLKKRQNETATVPPRPTDKEHKIVTNHGDIQTTRARRITSRGLQT